MSTSINLPVEFAPCNCLPPAADAAGRTGDYVSLKNAVKAWVVAYIDQGNAATIALTVQQASAVAGTGVKDINAVARIWSSEDLVTTNVLTRQTDGKTFTTSAAVKAKCVVFEIDPAQALDLAGGFDCITLTTGASNAANITSAVVYVQPKYPGAGVNYMVD